MKRKYSNLSTAGLLGTTREALRKLDLGGMSLFTGRGRGRGPREIKEGLGRYVERYIEILTKKIAETKQMTNSVSFWITLSK